MYIWHDTATFCEAIYGVALDTEEGYFVCPNCGEPIYECDWEDHEDWCKCPVCDEFFGAMEIKEG